MKNPRFLVCRHCGNVVEVLFDSGVPVVCCGVAMPELEANTAEASKEKHVPQVTINGDKVGVEVGSVPHPMQAEHYIGWIWLQTEQGGQRKTLRPGEKPKAIFNVEKGDTPLVVYAWCNIHGLWKEEL